jgi:hypothetical protein
LYLKGLKGQHTWSDSCNPGNQGHAPIAAEYDFEWEVGIAVDGTTRLFITDTGDTSPGGAYLDNLLFVKD